MHIKIRIDLSEKNIDPVFQMTGRGAPRGMTAIPSQASLTGNKIDWALS